jgi:hypothetical protein
MSAATPTGADWPALQGGRALPEQIECQRAVFGKVHEARSDFRWIAKSKGFLHGDPLERELYLGSQDMPKAMLFWRYLKGLGYFAGFAYRSRAQDAAGRGNFLEKQFAELGGMSLPAALAALLLLPEMRKWNDKIWWDRRDDKDWLKADSVLNIAADACAISVPGDWGTRLDSAISKGLAELQDLEAGHEGNLERFYASLLAADKPAILAAAAPLGPEALAVLLLPLPRSQADRLSLAGWIPSGRYDSDKLSHCWDAVVLPEARALSPAATERLPQAQAIARALLANRPEDLPVLECWGDTAPGMPRPEEGSADTPAAEATAIQPSADASAAKEQIGESHAPEPEAPMPPANPAPEAKTAAIHEPETVQANPHSSTEFGISKPAHDTGLAQLLYEFANKIRRRELKPNEIKTAWADFANFEASRPAARRQLATEIEAWIKALESLPSGVHKDQWEAKRDQLRVVLWHLAPEKKPKPLSARQQKIQEVFFSHGIE